VWQIKFGWGDWYSPQWVYKASFKVRRYCLETGICSSYSLIMSQWLLLLLISFSI